MVSLLVYFLELSKAENGAHDIVWPYGSLAISRLHHDVSCETYGRWMLDGRSLPWHCVNITGTHDDVIKWKHVPRCWLFVWGIHRWPVNSLHNGQWRRALMFFFYLSLDKGLSTQSRRRWFETPSRSLWRHCHVVYICPIFKSSSWWRHCDVLYMCPISKSRQWNSFEDRVPVDFVGYPIFKWVAVTWLGCEGNRRVAPQWPPGGISHWSIT